MTDKIIKSIKEWAFSFWMGFGLGFFWNINFMDYKFYLYIIPLLLLIFWREAK